MSKEPLELTVNYGGAPVAVTIFEEENIVGTIYPIELNGNYAFTFFINEDDDWDVLKESNGIKPDIEPSLKRELLRKLRIKLRDAA